MTRRVHLELMPKPRLIAMLREAQALADAHAATAERWRGTVSDLIRTAPDRRREIRTVTREQTERDAAAILARLPRDPHADEHRRELAEALDQPTPNPRPNPIEHGTPRGYRQHLDRQGKPCDRCRAAYNANRRGAA